MTSETMMASLAGAAEGESAEPELEAPPEIEVEEPTETTPEPEPAPAEGKATPEQIASNLQVALRESRAEQKAMREELAQLREQLKQQAKPEPVPVEEEPDFLADPKAYVDAKEKKLIEKLKAQTDDTEKTKAQLAEEQQRQALYAETVAQETQFVATTPDYPQALAHIRGVRTSQLKVLHPDATDEQVAGQIAFEEMSFARQLVAQKKNPAQFAYQYAQAMGYKPAKAPPPPRTNGNGSSRSEARTLGSAGGTDDEGGEDNHRGSKDGINEFGAAKSERFKKQRAS